MATSAISLDAFPATSAQPWSARLRELEQLLSSEDHALHERAGHALRSLDPRALERLPSAKIAVCSAFTCGSLEPLLRAKLLRSGLRAEVCLGGYDEYAHDILSETSALRRFEAPLMVLPLADDFVYRAVEDWADLAEVERAATNSVELVTALAEEYERSHSGTLVLNTIPMHHEKSHVLLDYKSKARLGRLWRDLNARLLRLSDASARVVVVDLESLLSSAGVALRDTRLAWYAGMSLSTGALGVLADEIAKICRALAGESKKCLALDLDDTLWGGILGDDGKEGLSAAPSGASAPFYELQRAARSLQRQGVLLTIASKNDEGAVREAFAGRPDFPLQLPDFVGLDASWRAKPEALKARAELLNLSLGSFVFVDDNGFEREMMRAVAPGVHTLDVGEDAFDFQRKLLESGLFNRIEKSSEDQQRTELYREDGARREAAQSFVSYADYLRSLEIRIELCAPSRENAARLAQLSQRTNQFNLTTRRRQAAEFARYAESGRAWSVAIQGGDRFGSYGLVGYLELVTVREGAGLVWRVTNFVLSCRVFSRGIEQAALARLLEAAKRRGVRRVQAEYLPSDKNARFESFYLEHGFARVEPLDDGQLFEHRLDDLPAPVSHIQLSEGNEPWSDSTN